jgi:hypothetical protein
MSILPSGTVPTSIQSLHGTRTDDGIYVFSHVYEGRYDFFEKPPQVSSPSSAGVTVVTVDSVKVGQTNQSK